jgi:hypothetical protein
MMRLLPYAAACIVGLKWDSLPWWVIVPTLLLCGYLVYTDSKESK